MKFKINIFDDLLKRLEYAIIYGTGFAENAIYFDQFLNSRQGELTVDEYVDEF